MAIVRGLAIGLGGLVGLVALLVGVLSLRYYLGRRRAEQELDNARYARLEGIGAVERLSVLPLVDWHVEDDVDRTGQLAREAAVSYLVRADDTTILLDLGQNDRQEHPSPLLRNANALGVDITDVDAVFITHAHPDHVGGTPQLAHHTFAVSGQPAGLGEIPAYVPKPLTHDTARTVVVREPQILAPGMATTGSLPRQLFFFGRELEQSLAVNVKGQGIVLIIGCGHPTIQRIVERAEMLFDEPVYGVIGGLHFPVTASRATVLGLPLQTILGTGKWPWDPIDEDDVRTAIAYLEARNPQLVALSPHDSCDWSIAAFRRTFGEAYQDLAVGKEIVVG